MSDDLVTVYTAATFSEAEMIHETLANEGIKSFIEPTPSPLDGLTTIGQGTPIMIIADDAARAERIINDFLHEHQTGDDDSIDDDAEG